MILQKLENLVEKIIKLDEEYNMKLDKYYQVTDEMREKAKTNNFMKLKILFFENRKIVGVVLLVIFIFQLVSYFNHKPFIQSGGNPMAAVGAAKAAAAGAKAASSKGTLGAAVKGKMAGAQKKADVFKSKEAMKHSLSKKAMSSYKGSKNKFGDLKRRGFEVADRMKAIAGIYFEVLYTLVMAVLIGVTLGPIIMVIVIFFVCFFSFRDQVVAIKRL
jgi:hypothetical protein